MPTGDIHVSVRLIAFGAVLFVFGLAIIADPRPSGILEWGYALAIIGGMAIFLGVISGVRPS